MNQTISFGWSHSRTLQDLVNLKEHSKQNSNFKYVMAILDVFSKYSFTCLLKQKTGKAVASALDSIFYKESSPKIVQSDNGKEFENASMVDLSKKMGIYTSVWTAKASAVTGSGGRFDQTLCRMIAKPLPHFQPSKERHL